MLFCSLKYSEVWGLKAMKGTRRSLVPLEISYACMQVPERDPSLDLFATLYEPCATLPSSL
jgi:hypothetical protein